MKKHLVLFIALLSMDGAFAAPGPGENGDSVLFPPAPPTASPTPASVNPFVDNVAVTLNCADGMTTYYDINNGAEFDPFAKETQTYTGTPISLPATSALRAVCYDGSFLGGGQSTVATWQYERDANPVVAISTPANNQVFHAGETVNITSSVDDADGPNPITVKYYTMAAGGGIGPLLGSGTGPNNKLDYPIPAGTAAGNYTLYAIASDKLEAKDTASITLTVAANQAPVARAGADVFLVLPTNSVQLDGSASSDPDGGALQYEWTGTGVTFTNGTTAAPTAQFPGQGTYTITLKVTDQASPPLSSTDQVVVNVYAKPAITSAGTASGTTGTNFSYSLTATGFPTPTLAMAAGNPAWLSLNPSTGALTGLPPAAGPYSVTLTATNTAGGDSKVLNITISDALSKPAITSPLTASALVGSAFSYTLTASGNPVPALSATGLPGWLTFAAATGTLSGTPNAAGQFTVNLNATNSQGSDPKNLVITVLAKPVITSAGTATGTTGLAFSYTLTATGAPTPALSMTPAANSSWLSLNAATGAVTGTPPAAGSYSATLTAANSQGTVNKALTITISDAAVAPSITSPLTASGAAGSAFTYTLTASGNPAPTLAASGFPAGWTFTAGTGILSGPLPASGPINVTLTAANTQGNDSKVLNIAVLTRPAITNPSTTPSSITIPAGQAFTYTVTAAGNPAPTLAATGLPPWLSFTNGALKGTPSAATPQFSVSLAATNSQGTDNKTLNITVGAPLSKPVITSPLTASGTSGEAFAYTFTATGNPPPNLSIGSGAPAWLGINASTGALTGTPVAAGDFTVKLIAANSQGSDNQDLKISVGAALVAPVITNPSTDQATASATANKDFAYTVSASGNPVPTVSATNMPAWLSFNSGTRVLSGTPPKGDFSVKLTATNSKGSDSKTLKISVSDSTIKPTFTNPGTNPLNFPAKTGTAFTYGLTATGTSPIMFTTSALPMGLSLAGSLISGSPTVTGTYPVTVTATNAYGTDSRVLNIIINADPKITTDLDTAKSVMDKSKATFTVAATGFPGVTYQWQYSATAGGAYANVGPNSASYTIDPVSTSSAGYYRVAVKNGAGPDVTSRVCHLTVTPLPAPIRILTQPLAASVIVGEKVRLVSKATGEPALLYQWFKGNSNVTNPKADDSVFTIASATVAQSGFYRLRVTNAFTNDNDPATFAFSDSVKLTIQEPKLPKPYAKPAGGAFYPSLKVVLANDTAGAGTYYTLDGTDPVQTSTLFKPAVDTIRLDTTKILKARSYKTGFRASDIATETYTYTIPGKVAKPAIKPTAPSFKNALACSLSTSTAGADIYFTTDGSDPRVGSPSKFASPFTITATTTITAVAKKSGMLDSDTLKMIYTLEKNPSKVLSPKITPPGGNFSTQIIITLSSPADTAADIWYTLDGTSPDTSSSRVKYDGTPLVRTKTTTIRVIAMRAGFLNSDVVSETYKIIPGPIVAQPASGIVFDDVVTVTLSALPAKAEIHYIQDGTPTPDSPLFPAAGLVLTSSSTISAIAIMDSVPSVVYSFSYTRKGGQLATPTPTSTNNQTTFKDTLRIWLTPPTAGADMYFTRNGSLPTTGSEKYAGSILIDSTTTIQVIAVQKGFDNSKLLVATYTLVPDKPSVSPPGGSYPTTVYARISSPSKASLYYTLDGNDPTPENRILFNKGDSIPISVGTTLKAVAVAGNASSLVQQEDYSIFGVRDFVIVPGTTTPLEGGYTLRIPEDQTSQIQVRIAGSAPLHLVGFEGVQYALTLALDASQAYTGAEFPMVNFTSPSSDKRSLYKIDPSGKVYFVSSADTVTLTQGGTYFMGIDTMPPTISYLVESFDAQDSTRVSFHIEDNIANLSYDLKRNDDPARNVSQAFVFSGTDLSVKLKHPSGTLKPLYIQIIVSDYQQPAFFPSDAATMLALSQRMGPIKGPASWGIGAANSPYDFISVPLALDPPLTLKDLRDANPAALIEGADWNNVDNQYHALAANVTLQPGQGYWLGSRSRVSSLSLPSATTLPTGKGSFSVVLRHGWNQIGNPHLEDLYWPYSRNLGEIYKGFPIKGLWEYSTAAVDYVEAEALKPWRGYYVYNYLEETTVTLLSHPVSAVALKKPGADYHISLSLGWGAARTLRLGADWASSDDLGIEDEFSLPQRNKGLSMRALRQGRALSTDWIRLNRGGIQQWKVALGGIGDSLPPLKILNQDLPDGFETWAVSPARALKFPVEAGKEIPASGLAEDTLLIFSGSHEAMAKFGLLQRFATAAAPLNLQVSARNGGFGMRMSLPSKARFRAIVWGLDGTRKGELAMGPLSEGFYRFDWDADFRNKQRLAQGMYFLSVEVQGTGLNTRLTRKIALSN